MLLRFEVSNHRSIMAPVELSMIAVDEDRTATRGFDRLAERVLTVAGIYGPNASGKSNLLDALDWLSNAVGRSLRAWDDRIPRDPFKFGSGPTSGSMYEIEMVINEVRYEYRVVLNDIEILSEGLYSYPERRRRMLFEREEGEISFRRGLGGLSGARGLLTPTTLGLSAAMRLGDSEIRDFGRSLARVRILGQRRMASWRRFGFYGGIPISTDQLFDERRPSPQMSLFDESSTESVDLRASALAMLRLADLGIDDVQIVEESPEEERRREIRLVHRAADEQMPFDIVDESLGTRTWFNLIGPVLGALQNGELLLFDEIDSSLHPRLSAHLLALFQDPETNPRGAQLIFTTHDTSLLNHLNRDEVWLTQKDEGGATQVTALAEFGGEKVRRSLNLEKAYLQGRFGAVPELDQLVLRRALGLVSSDR